MSNHFNDNKAIMSKYANAVTVKHVNVRTRIGLNSMAGKSETSFGLPLL